MTYYADLSPYAYADHDQPMLNVGWLDHRYPFPTGVVEPDVVARLVDLAATYRRAIIRGVQDCYFCGAEAPLRMPRDGGRGYVWLGTGEIRLESQEGLLYAAPTMICHYVEAHHYLPPEQFLDALRTGCVGPPESYEVDHLHPQLVAETALGYLRR